MKQLRNKNFRLDEIIGLKDELLEPLYKAREIAGIPFVINSGFRTLGHNKRVGGVADSAHLEGLAVDISCIKSKSRYIILKALLQAGFRRIELDPWYIHADVDLKKEQEVIWLK